MSGLLRPWVLFALSLVLLLATGRAEAGPWPREAGRFFTSTTSTLAAGNGWRPTFTEHYVEYGMNRRLTLGAALGHSWRIDYTDLFVRWHPFDLPHGLAFGITAGVRHIPYSVAPVQPFLQAELGRGMEIAGGNLWMQEGLRLYHARVAWGTEFALDWSGQVGFSRGRWLAMVTATHFRSRQVAITRIRPGIGVRVMDRFRLVGEAVIPPDGRVESLRLGLWTEF